MYIPVLIGHLIGDWIIQTDWQAENKTKNWKAMQQHMVGYNLCMFSLCVPYMPLRSILILIMVSWTTHSILDRRWPIKRLLELSRSKDFSETTWGVLIVDQIVHITILFACVEVLT